MVVTWPPDVFFPTRVRTQLKTLRQERIFKHIMTSESYEYARKAYVLDPKFRAMVDNLSTPIGGNSVNSPRIDALRLKLLNLRRAHATPENILDWKRDIRKAARDLDEIDQQFLCNYELSKPFWDLIDSVYDETGREPQKLDRDDLLGLKQRIRGLI